MSDVYISSRLLDRVVELVTVSTTTDGEFTTELGYIVGVTVDQGMFVLLIATEDRNLVEARLTAEGTGFLTVGSEYDAEVYLTDRVYQGPHTFAKTEEKTDKQEKP